MYALRASAAALSVLLLVLTIDHLLKPSDPLMVAVVTGALLLAIGLAGWSLWPLRRLPTDRQVARFIEERCPDLEDRLAKVDIHLVTKDGGGNTTDTKLGLQRATGCQVHRLVLNRSGIEDTRHGNEQLDQCKTVSILSIRREPFDRSLN